MPEQIRTQLEDGFAAWNRHDAAAVAALFPQDAVLRVVATGEAARGREEIRALAESRLRAFPDWRLEALNTYDGGEAVCVEWKLTATHEREFMGLPPTQRRIELCGCSIFKVAAGDQIAEEVAYFDTGTLMRQLGVLPEPPGVE